MPDATLTPDAAADFLADRSSDILACVLVGADGGLASVDASHTDDGEALAELGTQLLERAAAPQVEVSTGTGVVYALTHGGWTLVAVTGRFALSSLMFFDMRKALEGLGG
jgi:hypothetical protein